MVNWDQIEIIAKAIVVIGGLIVSLYQLYIRLPKPKGSLNRDIEILKVLPKNDAMVKIVKSHVDKQIAKIYAPIAPSNKKFKIQNWSNLIIGVMFLGIFTPWTYSLYKDGSLWMLLTGFLAFGGIGNIIIVFDKNSAAHKETNIETVQSQ
jgi:hypothetical protein